MTDYASANFSPLVSREHAGNTLRDALSLFVGRGRRYSVKQLSNATGVKDRVIECAMVDPGSVDYRLMPFGAILSIASFIGPVFATELLRPAGQIATYEPNGFDHDALCELATDYVETKMAAHREDSEDGREISINERRVLDGKAMALRAVGGVSIAKIARAA